MHLHYCHFDKATLNSMVLNSVYKNKFMLYQSINYDQIDISNYLYKLDAAVVFPFVMKEVNADESNVQLFDYAKNLSNKVYPCPLMAKNTIEIMHTNANSIGVKEHFILNNAFEAEERACVYGYLNKKGKCLILHCKDGVRIDYVKYLREKYPNMFIVLAHLGADRRSLVKSIDIIRCFSQDKKIYFDFSTIFDDELLKTAIGLLPKHIFFGSDMPYSLRQNVLQDYFDKEYMVVDNIKEDLFCLNAKHFLELAL